MRKIINVISYFLLYVLLSIPADSRETFMFTDLRLQTLMAEAKFLNPFLENLLNSISYDFNINEKRVKPIMGPLKGRERSLIKLFDEKSLNLLEIHDLARGTLIFQDIDDMYYALMKFRMIPFINITKIKDKFPLDNFYKDINMNFFFWNSTTFYSDQNNPFQLNLEVQFQICHLYHAKLVDDPVYHVRRLNKEENSDFFPNSYQKEVDKLFMQSKLQQYWFSSEFRSFKNSYFSLLTCGQLGEMFCDIYWDEVMQTLNSISLSMYSKAWKHYLTKKKCDLERFPPENLDLFYEN